MLWRAADAPLSQSSSPTACFRESGEWAIEQPAAAGLLDALARFLRKSVRGRAVDRFEAAAAAKEKTR
jgi:hypothetical protein